MVKFSKKLEGQVIPEWKEAFVDYWQLKKHVKKIKQLTRKPHPQQTTITGFLSAVLYPIDLLIADRIIPFGIWKPKNSAEGSGGEGMDEGDGGKDEEHQHQLLQLFSQEDLGKMFMERLEGELDKVNEFYAAKEGELVEKGEILKKQLLTLLDVKQNCLRTSSSRLPCPSILCVSTSERKPTTRKKNDAVPHTANNGNTKVVQEHVIKKRKMQCAEKMIRASFVELYRALGLLRNYRSLNMLAFVKILKKFDKVSPSQQHVSAEFLKTVKRSHFITSDKVSRVMEEVESVFVKHFTDNDKRKAMKFLKPRHREDSHMISFFLGLFTGSFVILFTLYIILVHLFYAQPQEAYMEIIYPIFSMVTLFGLHVFIYGCNLLLWKSMRINYKFIFDFSPKTTLTYKDAFLICTSIMTIVVSTMVVHLVLCNTTCTPQHANFILGVLFVISGGLLLCPLNILYRSTRYFFLKSLRNIICSPFYKVLMVDFFIADQLTSQIPLLRHMESTIFNLLDGRFRRNSYQTSRSESIYRQFAYVISFLPYYWRAMQCARRWFDESDAVHLANLGKYVSAMVAAGVRLTYVTQPTQFWMWMLLLTSVITTIYQLYWDFIKDWGILNPNSKNPWLRDELIFKKKLFYYIAIVLNLVLRVTWVGTILQFNVGTFEIDIINLLLASLEVIRRGVWNVYRVENEHLNNVGKFRAMKVTPLPFNENGFEV